jgi:uncharacterized protein YjiS (DUF1127 family)
MRAIAAIRHAWARHRAFKTVLAELDAYSDIDLVDLGIGRADVARIAWDEAARRLAASSGGGGSARRMSHPGAGFSFVGAR